MAKTKAPTGLSISRSNGLKFTCGWKVASKNHGGGQQLRWKTNLSNSWTTVTVNSSLTSKAIQLTASNYFPTTKKKLTSFTFQVRGKREATSSESYEWSAWKEKSFTISAPARPSLEAILDTNLDNKTKFSWSTEVEDDDHKPFTRVEWQTILVRACSVSKGSKLSWKSSTRGWASGTGSADGNTERTEDSTLLATDSFTRWVRVRAVGAGGASEWRYAKHVYATPYSGVISLASVANETNTTITVKMRWTVAASVAHPVDLVRAQYCIDTPVAGMGCPSGASWSTAVTQADTAKTDSAEFTIDDVVSTDQCLWVRVVSVHDRREAYSTPTLVSSGVLATPSGLSVTASNSTTGAATVAATNNSEVPDSMLAIVFRKRNATDRICGIITGSSAVTVSVPPWGSETVSFGVYAFQGTYSSARTDTLTQYTVTANMISPRIWDGGAVPAAPTGVNVFLESMGEARVIWQWKWVSANRAEVSWSKNKYAWESVEAPDTFLIDSVQQSSIRIPNLETGITWYFRVRLAQQTGDDIVYGPYSELHSLNMASAPEKPVVALSADTIAATQPLTVSWSYDSTDGTEQGYAEVWACTGTGYPVERLINTTTARQAVIPSGKWQPGSSHYLMVVVSSASGLRSPASDPVSFYVAALPGCRITSTSLINLVMDGGDIYPSNSLYPSNDLYPALTSPGLTEMPLTLTVTGAGSGGITTVAIERAESYQLDRPDESVFNGYEGETVAVVSMSGEGSITINRGDLVGALDDGARYRLVATTQDSLGQTATATITFVVRWAHQAIMPSATIVVDDVHNIVKITPTASSVGTGDVCDIYRLSADRPELIVEGGSFGTQYVDPYPTIGKLGGHRIVYRTANGDYITSSNQLAMVDVDSPVNVKDALIDFDGEQLRLPYNLSVRSAWKKDFQETKYLGGSVRGDWNPAVSRTGSIGTVAVVPADQETINGLRRLAVYSGICHVRTPDGSSYAADVQVTENREAGKGGKLASFTLSITRVDPEGLDGQTYSEWSGS